MPAPHLARALDPDESSPRPLPADVGELLVSLRAPARLAAHLRLVHDVAWQLTEQLKAVFPVLVFDRDAVLYGAATHDIGKVEHPEELTGPGDQHEPAGYRLLIAHGVPTRLARFARNHASWTDPDTTVDDHLVSLADKIWKAKRVPDLEDLVTAYLATTSGVEPWHAYAQLDDILDGLAADADHRLAYQASHPVGLWVLPRQRAGLPIAERETTALTGLSGSPRPCIDPLNSNARPSDRSACCFYQRFRQRCAASGLRCFTGHVPCRYTSPGVAVRLLDPLRSAVVRGRSIAWYFSALTGFAICDAA